ncbi:hypothetical protein ACLOJK_015986 [Asimina triloba]
MYEESTKVAFPLLLEDGGHAQELCAVGVRKKMIAGLVPIKIYAFGIYADCNALKEQVKGKVGRVGDGAKIPNEAMYNVAIGGDLHMCIRLEIVFSSLSMRRVKKIFNDNLRASIKKISGGDRATDDLLERVLGEANEDTKLPPGSVICITKHPAYKLQTKVKGEVVSEVESEQLCKAFFNMYLGDDPLDPRAKTNFGNFLASNIIKDN